MGLVTHARCAYIFIIVHSCWFVSEDVSLASALNAFESKLAMQHIHIWHRKQTKLSPPTYRSLTSLILKHTTSQLTVGRATILSNSTVLAPNSFYNTSFHLLSSHSLSLLSFLFLAMASNTMAGGLVTGSNTRNEVNVLHGDEVSPSFYLF